jgi:hypothetical protein
MVFAGDMLKKLSRVQVIETIAVFSLCFLVLSVYFQRQVFTFIAITFLVLALFCKPLAGIIACWWLKLSNVLSAFNNRLILTSIYYLILTPVALFYRLFNKDPLQLAIDKSGSFYSERNHTYSAADLEKMW